MWINMHTAKMPSKSKILYNFARNNVHNNLEFYGGKLHNNSEFLFTFWATADGVQGYSLLALRNSCWQAQGSYGMLRI